jgi:hypothetical protein
MSVGAGIVPAAIAVWQEREVPHQTVARRLSRVLLFAWHFVTLTAFPSSVLAQGGLHLVALPRSPLPRHPLLLYRVGSSHASRWKGRCTLPSGTLTQHWAVTGRVYATRFSRIHTPMRLPTRCARHRTTAADAGTTTRDRPARGDVAIMPLGQTVGDTVRGGKPCWFCPRGAAHGLSSTRSTL